MELTKSARFKSVSLPFAASCTSMEVGAGAGSNQSTFPAVPLELGRAHPRTTRRGRRKGRKCSCLPHNFVPLYQHRDTHSKYPVTRVTRAIQNNFRCDNYFDNIGDKLKGQVRPPAEPDQYLYKRFSNSRCTSQRLAGGLALGHQKLQCLSVRAEVSLHEETSTLSTQQRRHNRFRASKTELRVRHSLGVSTTWPVEPVES
ncbi:hypothetical protein RRG08_007926 [Elysia crispata]|uniref:Uncharacterized protein n=1 Tax=Elysia crispata TaxID=231223 RepID=A0AAE0ZQB7_9GAST|nr:hypothetical protein RRG08_007926 [Elysia crispata]